MRSRASLLVLKGKYEFLLDKAVEDCDDSKIKEYNKYLDKLDKELKQ